MLCYVNCVGNANVIVTSILLYLESDQLMQLGVFSETLLLT